MHRHHFGRVRSDILFILGATALFSTGCAGVSRALASPEEPSTVVGDTRCVMIQRDLLGDVKDARIAATWPDRNYGVLPTTCVGKVRHKDRLALFGFDLSGVPRGVELERASLYLHHASVSEAAFTVHRATAAWSERLVTWNDFGEAYEHNAETVLWTHANDPGVSVVDLTPLIREWLDGTSVNHGIVLRAAGDGPLSIAAFFTSESSSAADRPRLEVCFAPTQPGTPVADGISRERRQNPRLEGGIP